jgi:hypothetical protein
MVDQGSMQSHTSDLRLIHCLGFLQRVHPLEFLPLESKKRCHLMQLIWPLVIFRDRAKTLDPWGKVRALHFFGDGKPFGTALVSMLEYA